ncbi:MAG: hypothetical protein V1781_06460 [Bacteroidota bacterium]
MKNFSIKLFFFSFAIAIVVFCWNHFMPKRFYVQDVWFAFGFFITMTLIIHYWLISAIKKSQQIILRFMIVIIFKFFVYLFLIATYCLLKPSIAMNFVIAFLVLYFFFTAFEIIALMKQFKR